MKGVVRGTLFTVVVIGISVSFLEILRANHNVYQFTTYAHIRHESEEKEIVWVSKVGGRTICHDLGIYKRLVNPEWAVIDSTCVDGKEEVSELLKINYDTWFRGKFEERKQSQFYAHFRDRNKNDSLIYFSSPRQDSDQKTLQQTSAFFEGKGSNWRIVQPREL